MKIKNIKIRNYKQFKNLNLDLTYPKGHEKHGQPLDKVCFIGQSGTGKTTLLRLIKWYISRERRICENFYLPLPSAKNITMNFQFFDLHYTLTNTNTTLDYVTFNQKGKGKKKIAFDHWLQTFNDYLKIKPPILINYPPDLLGSPTTPPGQSAPLYNGGGNIQPDILPGKMPIGQVVDFAFDDIQETWNLILKDIRQYRKQEILRAKEVVTKETSLQDVEKKHSRYEKWKEQNPNPLETLADEFLDPMMLKLGLKVKTDISEHSVEDLSFIEVQALNGEDVARDLWSTGTRQLLLTLIPLYQLKPKNAVILVDEPERSLYPDIQLGIIDDYMKMAPTCQFFFATHSPIIASAFEPWEIVELKFDDERKIAYRVLNYGDENHVDNYKYDPRYLRWDSILMRIFELSKEGGKKRHEAMKILAEMNVRIKKLAAESKLDSQEGQKLADDNLKIKEKLDWQYGR